MHCFDRRNRYTAYRQLARWCWGFLGKNVWVPLPSCAVAKIREIFSSEQYQGFKEPEWVSIIWVGSKIISFNNLTCYSRPLTPIFDTGAGANGFGKKATFWKKLGIFYQLKYRLFSQKNIKYKQNKQYMLTESYYSDLFKVIIFKSSACQLL